MVAEVLDNLWELAVKMKIWSESVKTDSFKIKILIIEN